MARAIGYDVSRLFLAPWSLAPRGIDRIDLGLAERYFDGWAGDVWGVLPTPWGVRLYERRRVLAALRHLRHLWAEEADPAEDPVWRGLRDALLLDTHAPIPMKPRPPLSRRQRIGRMRTALGETGFAFGAPIRHALPVDAAYLNIGQIALAVPPLYRWLGARTDVTAIVMLHDVIPLTHGEHVAPSSARHHGRMIRTAALRAHGIVTTTAHARETVCEALRREGRQTVAVWARHLPLHPAFLHAPAGHSALAGLPYFVICGSIEPRKNHALLLELWSLMLRSGVPDACPHLVIAGSLGWRAEEILAPLARDPGLAAHVHVAHGLSTPALAQLMAGAAGVLMPSHAEGFGLPVAEARALGVPVIASDIPAHREIAGAGARLLPPDATAPWQEALREVLRAGKDVRMAPGGGQTLDGYFSELDDFVERCAAERAEPAPVPRRSRFGLPARGTRRRRLEAE